LMEPSERSMSSQITDKIGDGIIPILQEKLVEKIGNKKSVAWIVVAGSFLVAVGGGSIYCWGILVVFLSAPGVFDENESRLGICYAVAMFVEPYAMMAGAWLLERFSPKLVGLIAASLVGIGWGMAAFLFNVAYITCTLGVLCGVGSGIAVVVSLVTSNKHFSNSSVATISGVVLSALNIGSLFFGVLVDAVANPSDIPMSYETQKARDMYQNITMWTDAFHSSTTDHVPIAMVACAIASFLVMAIGSTMIANPKINNGDDDIEVVMEEKGLTPLEMIKTTTFWIWFIGITFVSTAELYVIRSFASFVVEYGAFSIRNELVGGCGALAGIIGRFVWGKVCDRIGYGISLGASSGLSAIGLIIYFDTNTTKIAYAVLTVLLFFTFAGTSVAVPKITSDMFGRRHFAINYSIIDVSYTLAAVLQAIIPPLLYLLVPSPRSPFYVMAFLCATTSYISLF
jgi:MFS transporter, OFA family, oxalate/formate antiporter